MDSVLAARSMAGIVTVFIRDVPYEMTLPEGAWRSYMESIVALEVGEGSVYLGDLARSEWHRGLRDWWGCKYPHISLEEFEKGLSRRVDETLRYWRR